MLINKKLTKMTELTGLALHILRGAIDIVYPSLPQTISYQFDNVVTARIAIKWDNDAEPSKNQIDNIFQIANDAISKDLPIKIVQNLSVSECNNLLSFCVKLPHIIPPNETYENKDLTVFIIGNNGNWACGCLPDIGLISTKSISCIRFIRLNKRIKSKQSQVEFVFSINEIKKENNIIHENKLNWDPTNSIDVTNKVLEIINKILDENKLDYQIRNEIENCIRTVINTNYAAGLLTNII